MSVHEYVEQYELDGALKVWTPYWVNEPGVSEGPFHGKGSPKQIQAELDRILDAYTEEPQNSEEVRFLMLRNALGIDCSGFVYHVLATFLKETANTDLAQELVVDKASIAEARANKDSWRNKISQSELKQLPEVVPLRELCDQIKEDPAQLTHVQRLCDERSSVYIKQAAQVKPADMIHMITAYDDHIGIVMDVDEETIRYASSDFDPVGPGGITFHEITISNLQEPLEQQTGTTGVLAVRRLKILS